MSTKALLSRREGADSCGVSLPTLDAWMRRVDDPLPHMHAGRRIMIPAEGLRAWIERQTKKAETKHVV